MTGPIGVVKGVPVWDQTEVGRDLRIEPETFRILVIVSKYIFLLHFQW